MTRWESHFNSIRSSPSPRNKSSPAIRTLYSTLLLVIKWHLIDCQFVSPAGVTSNILSLDPFILDESSACRVQVLGIVSEAIIAFFYSFGSIITLKSAKTSTRTYDFIEVRGWYAISYALNSTAHLASLPESFDLWRILHKGKVETIEMRWHWNMVSTFEQPL